jgi:hypothetical protein
VRKLFDGVGPALAVLLVCALVHNRDAAAQVVPGCGSLQNAYGPYDYRDPAARGEPLHLVEIGHFTPDVEGLIRGNTGTIIGDLDYALRAFPNHYRALQTIQRYALRGGKFMDKPAECYFKRAVAFRPDDAAAHAIYGNYLLECTRVTNALLRQGLRCADLSNPGYMDAGVLKAARAQYEEALRLAPESPEVCYSAGLFYVDTGDLATARRLAKVAYDAGYPLTGLRKKIEAAEAGGKSPAPLPEGSR